MAYRRNFYLVDTENMGTAWIKALPELGVKDRVVLFYTEKRPMYKSTDVEAIVPIADKLEWVCCTNGTPNALDFQLVTWLGWQIARAPKTTYIILSKDHGFDACCRFWQSRGVQVSRMCEANAYSPLESDNIFATLDAVDWGTKASLEKALKPQKPEAEAKTQKTETPLKEVPKADKLKISNSLKAKYRSDENVKLVYNAIISGNANIMLETARKIAGNEKDAKALSAHWKKFLSKCIKS